MRTHHLLQRPLPVFALPFLAFLLACGETPTLRSTETTGGASSINGSIAASKAVDVDLEATVPVIRPQSTHLRASTVTPPATRTDAFNALLSLEGTSVLAVNADGQVLGSSPIAGDGSFSIPTRQNQIVALMLANRGSSGAWVCQQPLEYEAEGGSQTAVLKANAAQIQAGRFSFKAATGRASSSTNQASIAPINDARFSSDSLNGFQRCGNPNVEEIVVTGDYNITWPQALSGKDPIRSFKRTMVLGLDTSAGGKPRFVGAGTVNSDGQLELRVRHEAGSSIKLSPTMIDERSLEPVSGPVVLMPTWNMGIPNSDVSQQADFGTIKAEVVLAEGELLAANQAPQVGASINASLESATGAVIAQTHTLSGTPEQPGQGAAVKLLLPKPKDPEASFVMKVVSADGLETARDVLQPNQTSFAEPKRWTTQPLTSIRTRQFGTLEDDGVRAMTVDAQQNLIVIGETQGLNVTPANQDVFVRQYSATGDLLWHTYFGVPNSNDSAVAVLSRADGTLLIASKSFDGTQSYLTKLAPNGSMTWSKNLSVSGRNTINITGLTQAANGDVYAGGWSKNSSSTGHDGLLLKYTNASLNLNQSGGPVAPLWSINIVSPGNKDDEVRGVTLDATQNLVVVGATDGELEIGHRVGHTDIFIARFDAANLTATTPPGGPLIHQVGTNSDDEANAIAADSSGNVYVTGYTGGGMSGPSRLSGFLQRFNTSLNSTWMSTTLTNDGSDAINLGLSVDQGSIYVTGRTFGPIALGSFAGGSDITVARFESDGSRTWLKQYGTNKTDEAKAVVVRNARVIIGGTAGASLNGQVPIGKQDAVLIDLGLLGN